MNERNSKDGDVPVQNKGAIEDDFFRGTSVTEVNPRIQKIGGLVPNPPLNVVTVDVDAIAHNTAYLRSLIGDKELMAVIKAQAYNHGAVPVARAVLAAGATSLGVTTIDEAHQLRHAGIQAPIMAWILGREDNFATAITQNIILGISQLSILTRVIEVARNIGVPAQIELKIDTGLRRNGLELNHRGEFEQLLSLIQPAIADNLVQLRGVFTHFTHADQPENPLITEQTERLFRIADTLRAAGIDPGVVHCANTAATLMRPDVHADRVRPGIGLYGYSPIEGDFDFVPAIGLTSTVIAVRRVYAGEGVSYGHVWKAPRDGYVALLPIGYADGLLRALSGKITVRIGDKVYPQVGRICMDQCIIDIGDNPHAVAIGDTAVLLGDGSAGEMRVRDWAQILDTIDYEIITFFRGRLDWKYVSNSTDLS